MTSIFSGDTEKQYEEGKEQIQTPVNHFHLCCKYGQGTSLCDYSYKLLRTGLRATNSFCICHETAIILCEGVTWI